MRDKFIPFAKPLLGIEEKKAASRILEGSTLTHGPECRKFEKLFGTMHKKHYGVTLSNCTSAMFLALKALGISKGDEVIVPAMTHIATAHCVLHTGAKVIFCDIDKNTGNINSKLIKKKISSKTKAIIVVHFVGLPAEMKSIMKIAKLFSLHVIEDCAAALGATYNKKLVGTFSAAGCFSFYPTKHITTMEGGMLISSSKKFSDRVRRLSSFGYNKTFQERTIPGIYDIDLLGYNMRMSEVAASIGSEQIKKLSVFLKKRKENANIIRNILSELKDIFLLPNAQKNSESSNFCINVVLKERDFKKRNALILKLRSNNLGTSVHYPICIPHSNFYKSQYRENKIIKDSFPIASHFADSTISLPCGPHLNKSNAKIVAEKFIKSYKEI